MLLAAIAASTSLRSNGTRRNTISSRSSAESTRAYAANASMRKSSSGCAWS
jgi:hypothetical protein